MKTLDCTGLVAASFTPMTRDGAVNLDRIPAYADYLHQKKIQHVFVNGTTGEGLSLTLKERKDVTEAWINIKQDMLKTVIVHVGCVNIPDTIDLARHAQHVGADAIALMSPTFFKPSSVDVLLDFCQQVAAAAPDLPFLYYHIPAMTGVTVDMISFCEAAMENIPTFCGIKYTSKDLSEGCILLNMSYKGQKMKAYYGCDQQLICAMALGFDSAVGTTYNIFPQIYQRLIQALNETNMEKACEEQHKIQKIVRVRFSHLPHLPGVSALSVMKTMMNISGFDVGPTRIPNKPMDETSTEALRKELKDMGYYNWWKQ